MQSVNRGNFVKVIGGSEALDAVTIPVVAVVETYLPKVTEGVIIESDSEGEELNVTSDIPFEVKVAVGELSSSVEVDLVSPPHVTDPAATVDFPSQPVLPEEAVPPDDKADAVKGMLAFQSPQELKSHNNKGKGDVLCIVYLLVSVLLHSASVLFCSALELFSGCYLLFHGSGRCLKMAEICSVQSAFELIRTCCNLLKTPFDVLLCPAAVLIKPKRNPETSWASSLPQSLVELSLGRCDLSDDAFPKDLGNLSLLRELDLGDNPITSLPDCIKGLTGLKILCVDSCTRLRSLVVLQDVEILSFSRCRSLERITLVSPAFRKLPPPQEHGLSTLFPYQFMRMGPLRYLYGGRNKLVEFSGRYKLEPIGDIDKEIIDNLGLFHLGSMALFMLHLKPPSHTHGSFLYRYSYVMLLLWLVSSNGSTSVFCYSLELFSGCYVSLQKENHYHGHDLKQSRGEITNLPDQLRVEFKFKPRLLILCCCCLAAV
ncbi:hypothetical protein RHMOL_Rhmol06G0212800 [Rhododendron molle]|uniref:Uncharacterized protein n=1 Tax=Rhododendron molle TaxID=49168 RepID=A0ACC0NEZ6_RHOML|nr:hypothetical protein RHMOL_Rhmol06G0212800 [Rhododendron molle]